MAAPSPASPETRCPLVRRGWTGSSSRSASRRRRAGGGYAQLLAPARRGRGSSRSWSTATQAPVPAARRSLRSRRRRCGGWRRGWAGRFHPTGTALLAAAPGVLRLAAEMTPAHATPTRRPEHRPWRASLVLLAHRPPATYGRLLADEPPARRWPHGTLVLDVLGSSWSTAGCGGPRAVAYRVTDRGEVVFAGDDAKLGHGHRPDSTAAVRVVLATVLARPSTGPGALGDRQRRLLAEHGRTLAAAALPADHPYPAGTQVRVQDPATGRQATGLVLAAGTGRGGLVYRWRPDAADLPGHPWRDHPRWALETPADQVRAVLDSPDLHTTNPDGEPALLATGALVAAIDDPRFTVATVLRAYAGDGPTPRYEIQPHDSRGGPLEIAAHEVTALAGSAWPSVEDLLLARAAADLPIRPFEVVIALRDCGIIGDGPHGPQLHARSPLADVGPVLDPAGRATPPNRRPGGREAALDRRPHRRPPPRGSWPAPRGPSATRSPDSSRGTSPPTMRPPLSNT